MEELSFIKRGDQTIYLKDATGRSMLAGKQNKLKAGAGIEITEDGTISAKSGNKWTRVKVEDYRIGSYDSYTNTGFDIEFEYFGNPALINQDLHFIEDSGSGTSSFDNIYGDVRIVGYGPSINGAILEGMRDLPDNGLPYLFIKPVGAKVVYVEEATEGVYTAGTVGNTSDLSFRLIYIEDNGSIAILNGVDSSGWKYLWKSSRDFGNTETNDYFSDPDDESLYLLMVRKLLGIHCNEITHD